MIGEVNHREAVAAVTQLIVELAQQVVGLLHGVQITRCLSRLNEGLVFSLGTIAGLRMRTHQVQHDELGLSSLRF
ncbi:hypothetical protein D3C73_1214240 [compost metagenome]